MHDHAPAPAASPRPATSRATTSARRRHGAVALGAALALVLLGAACTRSEDEGASPSGRARPAGADSGSGNGSGNDSGSGSAGGESDAPTEADPASVAPDPSDGCNGVGPDVALPGDERIVVEVDGTQRAYVRHVPPGYDGAQPVPVVLDLPGYANQPQLETGISGMGAAGDANGFVTLTPEALGRPEHWDTQIDSPDVDFLARVLDDAERSLCVDRKRVYATGFSEGGFMASTLACSLPDRIAAVAPVAGLRDVPGCSTARPVPVVTFHGTDDTFMLYDGGIGPDMADLPAPDGSDGKLGDVLADDDSLIPGSPDDAVPDIAGAWAERNGCEGEPDEGPVADDVSLIEFSCPAGASVVLYRVREGGHTWPGSDGTASFEYVAGPTTFNVDATAVIWEFFTAHPLVTG
jgi:polyhydroxybutyrate depolymerase